MPQPVEAAPFAGPPGPRPGLPVRAAGQAIALAIRAWRLSCRVRSVDDPRPALRERGRSYVIALRHAHQMAAVLGNDEPRLAAMVSRSADGELLVPSLGARGAAAGRGSTRATARDKGGSAALARLEELLSRGVPALIAVDGPRGPRGRVHRGVAELARRTGAPVVPLVVVPSRRWVLQGSWDRFQIPWPFATLTGHFAEPLEPRPDEAARALCERIARALDDLERRHDPDEAGR